MEKQLMKRLLTMMASVAWVALGSSAMAATDWNYNLSTQCAPGVNSGSHTADCGVSNPDLTLSGWSTANSATSAGTTFAAARIFDWGSGSTSGLGIVNNFEDPNVTGPHAIDNQYGTDAILLAFTNAVNLTSVGIGWVGSDADFSVLAYTGSGAGTVDGKTLLSTGWKVVANYAEVSQGSLVGVSAKNTDNTLLYSSYWLVSAYTATYGSSGPKIGDSFSDGKDYFKILSVAGNNYNPPGNKVPEPGSMLLIGIGFLGMMAFRRRQNEN